MTVFIKNVPLDDVHFVLKLLYAPMYTHNVIAKKVLKPTFDPYNSRTGCQIEAEVGLFYRAHRALSYIKILTNFFSLPYISQNEHIFSFCP